MRQFIRELVIPATLFFCVLLGRAQTPDVVNLPNFEEVARDGTIMYFVDAKDAYRTGRFVTVDVMGAHYKMDANGKTYALNNQAYIVSTFRVDCRTRTGTKLKDKGVWKGEAIDETFKNPTAEKPTRSRKLYVVIETVCGSKDGSRWKKIGGGAARSDYYHHALEEGEEAARTVLRNSGSVW